MATLNNPTSPQLNFSFSTNTEYVKSLKPLSDSESPFSGIVIGHNDIVSMGCDQGIESCNMGCVDMEDFGTLSVGISDTGLVGLFGRNRAWETAVKDTQWFKTVSGLGVRVTFQSIRSSTPHPPLPSQDVGLLVDTRQCALALIAIGLSIEVVDGVGYLSMSKKGEPEEGFMVVR
ncbi:hypothetical protein HK104_009045 [Borealophlyctis nickersoniae]|nr:hypothetical protein HK104_009045 [Borealophlyctis nickersoniae]